MVRWRIDSCFLSTRRCFASSGITVATLSAGSVATICIIIPGIREPLLLDTENLHDLPSAHRHCRFTSWSSLPFTLPLRGIEYVLDKDMEVDTTLVGTVLNGLSQVSVASQDPYCLPRVHLK